MPVDRIAICRAAGARVLLFMLLVFAAMPVLFAAMPAGAVQPAGIVERLFGIASATAAATGFTRPLKEGSTVLVGDRIETLGQARLRLRMNDGSAITLSDNSSIVIDVFDRNPQTGEATFSITNGIFSAVTGAIANIGPDRFKVQTPLAVLAVRGTEVWGNISPWMVDVAMLEGTAVDVITASGVVTLATAESGVTLLEGQPVPQPKQWGAPKVAAARAAVAFPE